MTAEMEPLDLAAVAAHSDEAATAMAHIARHGGTGGMTYIMRSAEDVSRLLAEVQRLTDLMAEQTGAITWETTCLGCARQLDGMYALTMRADTAEAEVQRLTAVVAELERNETSAIDDAIRNEEWADRLAAATAEHFGVDIGEHSNDNSPWANALEAFTDAVDPHVQVEAQSREISNLARQNAKLRDRDKVLTGRLVEAWHQGCGGDAPLCNYLELTWGQYQQRFGPAAVAELPACCDGKTRRCDVCDGHWEDGEPMRRCTYTCTHGERCDIAEPRPWHTHEHSHLGRSEGHTWSTKAAEQNPHARCSHAEQHHPHRWGQPAHWCDGTVTTTPAESCPDGANCCGGGACRG